MCVLLEAAGPAALAASSVMRPVGPSLSEIEQLEAQLLKLPQVEVPVTHRFAPGVYMREVFMKAGTFVIGHCHKTEHLNIISHGRASVYMNGAVHEIVGPCTVVSGINVRKALYIHEDMLWATIHPTNETDLPKLEEELIIKSDSFQQHLADLEALKKHLQTKGELSP